MFDVEVGLPALEMDLAGQRATGPDGTRVEDRVDRGAAHAEGSEQSFEHHGGVHSFARTYVRRARRRTGRSTDA
ncbi:hypothetical protein GCM10010267_39740 [Streptomyces griseorubens]|nr:hypothetical protein GCM10010267_39740 [Streptomyces griseorubens]